MGQHIRTLVLKFLLVFCRPLIEAGRVYAALSPLYHTGKGTKDWKYYIDMNDFIRYVRDDFFKNHSIFHDRKKQPFTKTELLSLIQSNNKYDGLLRHISDNYAIDPVLLEDLLILRNLSPKEIKKNIENRYRDLHVIQQNNSLLIDGIVGEFKQTLVFNNNILKECQELLPYLDRSEKRYLLDGQRVGLYELLSIYRESEPENERAKGLGSLNAAEIAESTMDPKHRKLLRYTPDNIEEEIMEMRKVNDDKFLLLKDVDISEFEF